MDALTPRFAGLTVEALSPQAIWVEDWARFIMNHETPDFPFSQLLSGLAEASYRYQPNSDHRTVSNRQIAVKWLMGKAVNQVEECCARILLGAALDATLMPYERAQAVLDRIEAFYTAPLSMALVGFLAPHVTDFAAWNEVEYPAMGIDGYLQDYLTLWCTTLEAILEPLVGRGRAYDLAHHSLAVLYGARCLQWTGADPNAVRRACAYLRQGWFCLKEV